MCVAAINTIGVVPDAIDVFVIGASGGVIITKILLRNRMWLYCCYG